jgi:copper transport protein
MGVDPLVLPLAGMWEATVGILIDDFEKASLDGTISIRP